MSQIIRSNSLRRASISKKNLDERTILAVGWAEGELLPEFDHPRTEEQAQKVHDYLNGKTFLRAAHTLEIYDVLEEGNIPWVVEIVGGIEICTVVAADYVLEEGSKAVINPELIVPFHPNMPPYWVGRILLRDMSRTTGQ